MSTRANIIIKDRSDELIFYRHCDGYPKGTLPTLEKFLGWVKEGRIRSNVSQAAGWLVLIGAEEYAANRGEWKHVDGELTRVPFEVPVTEPGPVGTSMGWKCGAYEPTTGIHGDIAYLYVVDLHQQRIHVDGQDGYHYAGLYERPVSWTAPA